MQQKRTVSAGTVVAAVMGAVLCGTAMTGCGGGGEIPASERVEISGTITLDGKPFSNAEVVFVPLEGDERKGTMLSITNETGSYTIAGVPAGEYRVRIDRQVNGGPNPALSKYHENSELRAEVSAEQKQFDFDLTSGS